MTTKKMDGKTITFENETAGYCFELASGRLLNLYSVKTGWNLIRRPELAKSFSLLLPLEGRRNNPVEGGTPTSADITEHSVAFIYETICSKYGGEHPVTVVTRFTIEEQAGRFECYIDNRSDLIVENVCYPVIDDFQKPEDEEAFYRFHPGYSGAEREPVFPTFPNKVGYWGSDTPIQFSMYSPISVFALLVGEKQGVYLGMGENTSEIAAWKIQLFPGYENSMTSSVPKEELLGGALCHTCVSCAQLPYVMPKTERQLVPVVVNPFVGDWHQGADIYKNLVKQWGFQTAEPPEWAREPHSWLQLHINSPEDELRYRYSELVDIGRECAAHGIKAIQLVGWNDGGQDRGNPSHSTDDRLGTFDELKQAIRDIKQMGVKVILFAKYTWADRSTEWFREELIQYAAKDPYGDYYVHPGYQYQTVAQHLDVSTRRLIPMCFGSEEYLEICNREFQKMVDLGADGILFDESQHHGNALLCFDESHHHRYGASNFAGGNRLIEGFRKATAEQPDFLFAGEACYELEFAQYHLAYMRSNIEDFVPVKRYMFPHALYMTAVIGFDDRNMINQCLMYRFIISYEPYHFKGRPGDYPLTLEYGKKMDALRAELRDYFWDGEFLHTTVGSVTDEDGARIETYAAYRSAVGKIGVVIANYKEHCVTVTTKFDQPLTKYRFVDGDEFLPYTERITLPPRSAVVMV